MGMYVCTIPISSHLSFARCEMTGEGGPSVDADATPRPFIVDTDAGNFSDDFWALALQLCDPSVDIKFVVTSGYETRLKTKVVAKFLSHCGRNDIPLVRGVHTEEARYLFPDEDGLLQQHPTYEPGCVTNPILRRWAQDYDLSVGYDATVHDDEASGHGLLHLMEVINSTPNLTYVIQGSSENVSYMLDRDPDLFSRNAVRIFCMGGTLEKDHEDNFALDPVGTRRMLRCASPSRPVTVVPIEPSFHAKLHGVEHFDEGDDPNDLNHNSYSAYLNGDSRISLAMAQLQLALGEWMEWAMYP